MTQSPTQKIRYFNFKIGHYGIEWLIRLAAFSQLLSYVISPRLWSTQREVPVGPIWNALETVPEIVHQTLFLGACLSSIILILKPRFWQAVAILNLCWLCLAALDLLRFQDYYLFYSILLSVLTLAIYSKQDFDLYVNTARAMMVGLYFWAGLHKINYDFAYEIFPWIQQGVLPALAPESTAIIAIAAAILEGFAGVGLLFQHSRKFAVAAIIVTHLFVLWSLGPLGRNFHLAVLPWNAFQPIAVIVLFSYIPPADPITWKDILSFKSPIGGAVRILVMFFPALNIWGLWPDNPSHHLYSGSMLRAHLVVDRAFIADSSLPMKGIRQRPNGTTILNWLEWSEEDTGHLFSPSEFYYKSVFQRLCLKHRSHGSEKNLRLILLQRPVGLMQVRPPEQTLRCSEELPDKNATWWSASK